MIQVYQQGAGYLSTIGHFSSFFVLYLVSCRYKFMYLSSLLMNQSPCVFMRVTFYLHIHILPSITGYNHS